MQKQSKKKDDPKNKTEETIECQRVDLDGTAIDVADITIQLMIVHMNQEICGNTISINNI